jgi:hypothetical protein
MICRRIRWICSRTARVLGDLSGGPPCSGSTSSLRWLIAASMNRRSASAAVVPPRSEARALDSTCSNEVWVR